MAEYGPGQGVPGDARPAGPDGTSAAAPAGAPAAPPAVEHAPTQTYRPDAPAQPPAQAGPQPPAQHYAPTQTYNPAATPPPPAAAPYVPTQAYTPATPPPAQGATPPPAGTPYVPTQTYNPAQATPPPPAAAPYVPTQTYNPATPPGASAAPPPATPPQGYAAPPPAQDGYGYPQAGYGYPQAGYGYPQQAAPPVPPAPVPGYPAPYGYPQGAPAPKRGLGGGLIAGIIAGVVVLAAIATAVVVLTTGGGGSSTGGGGGGNGGLSKAWSVPSAGADDRLIGSWLTAKTVIRASTGAGVVAYNISDGSKAWTLTPPADGTVPCAASPTTTSDGIGTMAFGTSANTCSELAGVDSATGRILWTLKLTDDQHGTPSRAQTFITGSVATVINTNVFAGVDVRTGNRVWGYTARGNYCNETMYGTTGVVLVDDFCADDNMPRYTLTAMDAATGKTLWRKTEDNHTDFTDILSGNPVVAAQYAGSSNTVEVFDGSGNARQLSTAGATLASGGFSDGHSVQLIGNTLVVQNAMDSGSTGATAGKVVAYDLTSGSPLWTYNGESQHGAVLFDPAADGKLYALSTGSYEGSPHLVQLDPVTGKSTVLGALPAGTDGWSFTSGTLYTVGGAVIALNDYSDTDALRVYR
ncbi:PQQ-binding-like beta-propeller repeat protein [Streptacidiphilus sp. EB129]|uniref:outer membrane protein assembly factor BamB family protein n=1 Tax=Streptacidiphilus sp. EB129 TaxID=3156262 RepID=UPI003514902B